MLLRHCLPRRLVVLAARSNASLAAARCPSCSSPLPTALPTCPNCKYIGPLPSDMSFYQYFSLPTSESSNPFTIDTRDLRRRFLRAQRLCHPDAWTQKGESALAMAIAQSSQLNEAYRTLLSPLDRARYILSLHGIEEFETEKLEDDELLMQVMEARQEVEEASDAEELSRVREVNRRRIDSTVMDIERLIGEKDWAGARVETVKLKYWMNVEGAAKERTAG